MSNNVCDAVLVSGIRFALVKQDSSCAVSDKAPVLHSTHGLKNTMSFVPRRKSSGSHTNSWTARRSALGRGYSILKTFEK